MPAPPAPLLSSQLGLFPREGPSSLGVAGSSNGDEEEILAWKRRLSLLEDGTVSGVCLCRLLSNRKGMELTAPQLALEVWGGGGEIC